VTNDEIIARGLAIRNEIAAIKERHKAELLDYENGLQAIENYLLGEMLRSKQLNIKTAKGTAFQSEQLRVSMDERDLLLSFVFEPLTNSEDYWEVKEELRSRMGFFTNHVAKDHVKEYMDANQGLAPPGVKVERFTVCHIRKP